MIFYHVVSDEPKQVGQHFVLDDKHPNGVYKRVFSRLGRPTYCVAKIEVNGNCYYGDAYKCFDGTISEEENLRLAEIYWLNGPNKDGHAPIIEVLVDGDIEVVEILKDINANIN